MDPRFDYGTLMAIIREDGLSREEFFEILEK